MKKKYITPLIDIEEIEMSSSLCDASVFGPDQPGENLGEAKSTYFEEDFEDAIEEENPWELSANYFNQNW